MKLYNYGIKWYATPTEWHVKYFWNDLNIIQGLKTSSSLLLLLLLLLSLFSRVRLCATSSTAAHQAPPSPGFSRQEHWSGLPFPFPMHESEKWSEVAQSCPTLTDPVDCAHQAPPSMGFSRQEYWSGVPLSSPSFFAVRTCKIYSLGKFQV